MKASILRHTAFWVVILLSLIFFFGRPNGDYLMAFYFGSFLLPVVMATSYFFSYFLVPRYLLEGRHWQFAIYLLYTVVLSLYLEMLVMTLSFILFAHYQFDQMLPFTGDILAMGMTLYFIVFVVAFIRLVRALRKVRSEKDSLTARVNANSTPSLLIRSERKNVPVLLHNILYIESLADYVRIYTQNEMVVTREKISRLEAKLPDGFVRTHRSFIVNTDHIQQFNNAMILINGKQVPISRSYRDQVINWLTIRTVAGNID